MDLKNHGNPSENRIARELEPNELEIPKAPSPKNMFLCEK